MYLVFVSSIKPSESSLNKISNWPWAFGKQLNLFDNDYQLNDYKYTCYITTLNLSAADIWGFYGGRANCENRKKNLNSVWNKTAVYPCKWGF